jgi:Ca2+/H+ antiporter
VLVVSVALVAVESELLVGVLGTSLRSLGLSELFVGLIVVPTSAMPPSTGLRSCSPSGTRWT